MSMFTRMKETLLENTFLAYKRGLFAGTSGNLSCLDATGTKIAITPSSYPYEKMTQDDIVIIEAFPFGRRQMRFELLPLLDAVTAMRPAWGP